MTHPFHPLRGLRVAVLFERDYYPGGRLFVCEGGPRGSIGIWEDSTDRAPTPASGPLTADVLAGLVELVAAISGTGGAGRTIGPVRETGTGS